MTALWTSQTWFEWRLSREVVVWQGVRTGSVMGQGAEVVGVGKAICTPAGRMFRCLLVVGVVVPGDIWNDRESSPERPVTVSKLRVLALGGRSCGPGLGAWDRLEGCCWMVDI